MHASGKRVGPLTPDMVLQHAASITPTCLCWKRGMVNWLPCKDIPELCSILALPAAEEEAFAPPPWPHSDTAPGPNNTTDNRNIGMSSSRFEVDFLQVDSATSLFLDMNFSGRIEQDKCQEQIALLAADSVSALTLKETVQEQLDARRACEQPTYKKFTAMGFACICGFQPKLDIFSLMVLIALMCRVQNCAYDWLSAASFIITLPLEFLICIICLSEGDRCPLIRKFCNLFPTWILNTKKKHSKLRKNSGGKSVALIDATNDAHLNLKSSISQFDEAVWEYSVPFLVFFRGTFSPETRVFNHKIPRAFSPALLFARSAANILVISAMLILRFAMVSYNSQMFNVPQFNLPFDVDIDISSPTEFAVCSSLSTKNESTFLVGFGYSLIHTGVLLNLFIVIFMGLTVKWFSLKRESIACLEKVSKELRRHSIKFHSGSSKHESAFSLWNKINDFWIKDMFDVRDDFLAEIMGFQDVAFDSCGRLNVLKPPKSAAKRLLILSLIPLLLASIVPVVFYLARNPSIGNFLRIDCFEQSCLQLFSKSVIGNCSAASNSTVIWAPKQVYYHGCLKCAIIIHGSFSTSAYYSIYTVGECSYCYYQMLHSR
jgi:hypothetical protein